MTLVAAATMTGRTWIVRASHSPQTLSVSGCHFAFLFVAVVSLIIATGFALLGAWPVIPFAGVELAALWWGVRHYENCAKDYEKISLEADRLTVEARQGEHFEKHYFTPYWTQLQYSRAPGYGNHRLIIKSHGKEIEVGSHLTIKQKTALANELKKVLGAR